MCYFVTLSSTTQDIEHRYGVKYYAPNDRSVTWSPPVVINDMINGFAHPVMPIITGSQVPKIEMAEWGLVPFFVKDIGAFRKKSNTLNAMIETVAEKSSFRNYVEQRCLVMVNGFFEYKWMDAKGKVKMLHCITRKNANLFALAGIFSTFTNDNGLETSSFTILTTEANTLMKEIHNTKKRMPVVLHDDEESLWLTNDDIKHYIDRSEIDLEAVVV